MNDPQHPPKKLHPLEEKPQAPAPPPPPDPNAPRVRILHPHVRPYFTWGMIAVLVVLYGLSSLDPSIFDKGVTVAYDVLLRGEYHRLFTGMFLHANLIHLFFNCYSLYIIGTAIEPVFGHQRFATVYLLGGVLGSVLSVVLRSPDTYHIGSIGASGGVFAVLSAMGIYFYRNQSIMGDVGKRALQQVLVIMGLNLIIGIASTFDSGGMNIDNWGHIGGAIGGAVLTWFIGPIFKFLRDPHDPLLVHMVDSRPFKNHYWVVSAYGISVLAVLGVVTLIVR